MVIEKRQINGIDRLEVIIALLIKRRFVTIVEIVIDRDRHRIDTIHAKLDTEPLCKGRFTRRRRACDQDQAKCTAAF